MSDHIVNHGSGGYPPGIDPARLRANWRAIENELDAPRPTRIERLLRRLGVPSQATRLVVATPALRRSWYAAVAAAVLVAFIAADPDDPRRGALVYLTIAPLVGVLGVAMAYGPSTDPAHELQLATPMRGVRVLAIRTLVVMVIASMVITGVTLLSAVTRPFVVLWWLPAIAVAAVTLATMTVLPPRRSAMLVAIAWSGLVLLSQIGDDPLTAFSFVGQVTAIGVSIAAGFIVVSRRASFDRLVVAG